MSDAVPTRSRRRAAPRSGPSSNPDIPENLEELWRAAQDEWSVSIDLQTPLPIADPDGGIAFIDLRNRLTQVNFGRLKKMGLTEHVKTILAHEVGHHIRYPHTLSESRRLLRFQRELCRELFSQVSADGSSILPVEASRYDFLLNIFLDLLINDDLSDRYESSFVAIYSAMARPDWGLAFGFYMGVFEELWGLQRNAMLPSKVDERMTELIPSWRARARSAGEFIRSHPENRALQMARFLLAIRPFVLSDASQGKAQNGESLEKEVVGGGGQIDGDGVRDLLRRRGDEEAARRWLRRTLEGTGDGESDGTEEAPPEATGGGTPGSGGTLQEALDRLQGMADVVEVAIAVYRISAERTPLELPRSQEPGESNVPGPFEAWDLGDDLAGLDWMGSVLRAGGEPIPGLNTVRRTYLPTEPQPGTMESPWLEIYMDSSGSMPDPTRRHSHQVEAGFVLTNAAIKAGGRVRIIHYSSEGQVQAMKRFVRSRTPAYRALAGYIGGGTWFPWKTLAKSLQTYKNKARVRRIVLSDGDFVYNSRTQGEEKLSRKATALLQEAASAGGFTALLDLRGSHYQDWEEQVAGLGVQIVKVADWSTVAEVARALSSALFDHDDA